MTLDSKRLAALLGLVALLALASGCGATARTKPPTLAEDLDRLRGDLDVLPPIEVPAPASGSIWTDAGPGAALTRDTRAYRLNDLVTIDLEERSVGRNESETDLTRESDSDFSVPVAFGLEKATTTPGKFNLNQVLQSSSTSTFKGDGTTSRSNLLSGNVTTRVMRVMPNGDLVIGGQKTVMINRERQILTLVGTVRTVDIDATNRVPSASVGDLTVRLWGHGEVDATIRQGWFQKMMNRLWPF